MPYADLEERKACAKRYHAKPGVKERFARLQRERTARLIAEDPEKYKEQRRIWQRTYYQKNRIKTVLNEARRRAKKKGLPFDLKPEDIVIPEFCPVLGLKLEPGIGQKTDASPSLDRVFPSKGYVKGNIRVISWRANRIKFDSTINELQAVINYMIGALPF